MKYASSTSAIIDLNKNGLTYTAIIYTNGGYFQWTWNLVGEASGNPLTCATAGADRVELLITMTASTSTFSDIFDRTDGSGLTAALPAGGYTISSAALNGVDASLRTALALTNSIQAPNRVTDLGIATIPLTGL